VEVLFVKVREEGMAATADELPLLKVIVGVTVTLSSGGALNRYWKV